MANKLKIIFLFLPLLGCHLQKSPAQFEKDIESSSIEKTWSIYSTDKWLIHKGLINVESILYDERNQVFYATNGKNYELGTSGFISRISKEGSLQELKWVSNLNRPTGMAIFDSLLYVADVNSLIKINTRNGQIIDKYKEPIPNSGLNDVAISKEGKVYVSGSFIHSVYELKNGGLKLFIQDEESLKWANGIIANDKQLIIAGLNLSIIDTESKEISNVRINEPVKDFDGIVSDGEGGYFLTTVENSGLFHINEERKITKLLAEDIYFGDLEFNRKERKIYIPRGNKKNNEFFITVLRMEKS